MSIAIIFLFIGTFPLQNAAAVQKDQAKLLEERMIIYKNIEVITNIPWYYIAAVDQYERNIRKVRKDLPDPEGILGIYFPPEKWSGPINPNQADTNPKSILIFNGIGMDGNGDGKADSNNPEDALYTFANYLHKYGSDEDNLEIGLWDYYKRDKAVGIITGFAKMYKAFGTLDLYEHHFPLPLRANYSYRDTWGDARGWGGRRIHEGTDIFADYGVNVFSTCYGIVELKGWNKYGGWRIGIRDINNTYHYFGHLNGYAKDLKIGDIVRPGQLIGSVGSSGYGPPGTSGKFPPHLHYGMYKDNGKTEWSFDPYPHLKLWERQTRQKARARN
ncbi:M23 family metallopeptidase [Caldibacillus lycopersici]|uniref:M23 family metallopeptidase n=2 Tax=Perspicuibacillus lycopersici TaxID=1325689 RepID=A0AAE3IRF0_9BACI|nr:M23 family metallopeptidase [Perspicuibacillus lycopersici]